MSIKEGEVGKLLILGSGGFNLSGNTELKVILVKPDGTVIEKLIADGVSAPNVNITVDVDGVSTTFLANEYWQYPTEVGVMVPAGTTWKTHGEYVDATPKDFCGDETTFTVLPCEG